MAHRSGTFCGWLLALTITVMAAFPHVSVAGASPLHSRSDSSATAQQDLQLGTQAARDCHISADSHAQAGGCAAMASHCASLLPQVILLPRQMNVAVAVDYSFGVIAARDVASVHDTPPPRA